MVVIGKIDGVGAYHKWSAEDVDALVPKDKIEAIFAAILAVGTAEDWSATLKGEDFRVSIQVRGK